MPYEVQELSLVVVWIDERAARRVAKTRQLPIIGTVGILILAKQRGLIDHVQPILDGIIKNVTRIGERLYMQTLILSQETNRTQSLRRD